VTNVILIDDDLQLVQDLRTKLLQEKGIELVAPPDVTAGVGDIKPRLPHACALVLDLNINGSPEAGIGLLKSLKSALKTTKTPVVFWSKYLIETTKFEEDTPYRWHEGNWQAAAPSGADALRVEELRKVYPVSAFISKLEKDSIGLICELLSETASAKSAEAVMDAEQPQAAREAP
jgi:CheY-like chemotaxis protein